MNRLVRRIMRQESLRGDGAELRAQRPPAHQDVAYPWLNEVCRDLMRAGGASMRASYAWGMLQSVYLASVLGVRRVSSIEFGVAGGNGLVAMERTAELLGERFDVEVEVYGFDSGVGLPKPVDHRDLPHLWREGAYPMDEAALRARLKRAELLIGDVEETVGRFIARDYAPIGFISFDLDLYSSTVPALRVLRTGADRLLPRVHCYFDDVLGFSYGDHNGERLAIREFNDRMADRKLSQIYGLRFYVHADHANAPWTEKMYLAHVLDHTRYGDWDGQVSVGRMDLRPHDWRPGAPAPDIQPAPEQSK